MTCGVGCRRGWDLVLLPLRPLAWEPPYAVGVAQEMAKRQKKKKKKKKNAAYIYSMVDFICV